LGEKFLQSNQHILALFKATTFLTAISLFGFINQTNAATNNKIQAYFNHNPDNSYTEPYRTVTRKGDNLEQEIINTIKTAKKSIYMAVHELRLPNIAKALVAKKRQGVDVRVVLENTYHNTILTIGQSFAITNGEHEASRFIELFAFVDTNRDGKISKSELSDRDAVHILKENKISIKDDTFDHSTGSGLMHHKFVIVDGKKVIVSTANFTMSGIHGDMLTPRTRGNANSMVRIESREMAEIFTTEFFHMWGGKNGKGAHLFGSKKPYRGRQSFVVGATEITVQFSPTTRSRNWALSVNGLIGSELKKAKSEILMALFVFSEQKLADIMKEKYENIHAFNIGLLIESRFAYRNYSEMLDMWGVSLADENCSVEENNNPWSLPLYDIGTAKMIGGDMLHHKYAVVDGKTVLVGSQNWSDSANRTNDENIVIIRDKSIAKKFRNEFLRLNRGARKGPTKSLMKRIKRMNEICENKFNWDSSITDNIK